MVLTDFFKLLLLFSLFLGFCCSIYLFLGSCCSEFNLDGLSVDSWFSFVPCCFLAQIILTVLNPSIAIVLGRYSSYLYVIFRINTTRWQSIATRDGLENRVIIPSITIEVRPLNLTGSTSLCS